MLLVSGVLWVRDLEQVTFQSIVVAVLKANLQLQDVLFGRASGFDPGGRNCVGLFEDMFLR